MPLHWNYDTGQLAPCYFPPDHIGAFSHDAKDTQNMLVLTAKGEPVCGRVVDGATETWIHTLEEGWVLT
jgi:hypothetical protein